MPHDVTGFPMTSGGWTDFTAMYQSSSGYLDSRIMFVSTSGNDDSGVVYDAGDPELGGDPFSVTTGVMPFATFGGAYANARDGYPDIVLLKRGDTWTSASLIYPNRSGRSASEPAIIAAYGESGDLPKWETAGAAIVANDATSTTKQSYIIIADQHFEPSGRSDPSSSPNGVIWQGSTSGLLIEGCRFLGYATNLLFESVEPVGSPVIDNVTIRRNVIADAWSNLSHSQGIYTMQVLNFLIEENVFDHNGWNEAISGAEATVFNRSMYLNYSPLMTVRGKY
jgi:hypothetical protein